MEKDKSEFVILTDENDNIITTQSKLEAHQQGNLHRAFSVFIFNKSGEMLLQQRALDKYHSGGKWSNACCSHPRQGEKTENAAHRRLQEEMGFDCEIEKAFDFIYRAQLDRGLIEHEFDHVFVGTYDGEITPNPDEVENCKWMRVADLKEDVQNNPDDYTVWFKIALDRVLNYLEEKDS